MCEIQYYKVTLVFNTHKLSYQNCLFEEHYLVSFSVLSVLSAGNGMKVKVQQCGLQQM